MFLIFYIWWRIQNFEVIYQHTFYQHLTRHQSLHNILVEFKVVLGDALPTFGNKNPFNSLPLVRSLNISP